jgi:DNA-binding MarR family transcriptional regulator
MGRRAAAPKPLRFLSPLHRASRQIEIHLRTRLRPFGLDPTLAHVVAYLGAYGPCAAGELARVFGARKSTLTGILDRLEAAGLAVRSVDPGDRRSVRVATTPLGRRTGARLRAAVLALEEEIADRLTAEERRGFDRVMEAIAAVTRVEVRPGRAPGPGKEGTP